MSHTFQDHFYNIFRHDSPPSVPFCCLPFPKYFRLQVPHFPPHRPREYYDPKAVPMTPVTSVPCNVPSGLRSPQRYSESVSHICFSHAVPIPELPAWNHTSPLLFDLISYLLPILPPVTFPGISPQTFLHFRRQSRRHVSRVHYCHREMTGLPQSRKKQAAVQPDPDDRQFRYPAPQQSQLPHVRLHYAIVPAPVPVPSPAASCSFPVK